MDLNPDLTNFPNPTGFGFDLKMLKSVDLDLTFFKLLDLDLDLKIVGFDLSKSTNPLYYECTDVHPNFSTGAGGTASVLTNIVGDPSMS